VSMTLLEALASDEVGVILANKLQEALDEAFSGDELPPAVQARVDAAVDAKVAAKLEEQLPALRESVKGDIDKDHQVRSLHTEAVRVIGEMQLSKAAKANLLEDYGLVESDDDTAVKPGRALALVEAAMDGDKVVKSAKVVLREAIEEDAKRIRNVLRESAPSFPVAPGGGAGAGGAAPEGGAQFLGDQSPTAKRMREQGLDPAQFGATPTPEPAKA
jgi:hypothetical protein